MKSALALFAATLACATPALAFDAPGGIAVDSAGNAYVTNAGASGYVAVYDANLQRSATLTGVTAPATVAVDSQGRVFVGNGGNTLSVYAPGQSVPGGVMPLYDYQPVRVRIGSYDDIWVMYPNGFIYTYDQDENFLHVVPPASPGATSFDFTGPNLTLVGADFGGGVDFLEENAIDAIRYGTAPTNTLSLGVIASDVAYDPAAATTWLADPNNIHLTTFGPLGLSDPGLRLGWFPAQIALDVPRCRVFVVEPGKNQVEVFNYKTRKKIGVLL